MPLPILEIAIPEYQVVTKPDFQSIGAKIHRSLIKHFLGQKLVIRCIGSQEHPEKTTDQLIQIIRELGTDRYDPRRQGDRYDNLENKAIDIFALDFTIKEHGQYLEQFIEPFYTWPKSKGDLPIKLDIIILYDHSKLKKVIPHERRRAISTKPQHKLRTA